MEQEKYWKIRSESFNKLDWVSEGSYLEAFVSSTDFNRADIVLDIGTGTGTIANAISPYVKQVIGLDISQDMFDQNEWHGNKNFIKGDIKIPLFVDGFFDKITARMTFHHIIDGTEKAMAECYRVLKTGGKMILAEGIPPTPEVKQEYIDIFRIKEERLTFLEEDLFRLMVDSGFKIRKNITHIIEKFSVKNWIENCGLAKEKQEQIYNLHINASEAFKTAYNMVHNNGDCYIDVKNLIMVGEK